MRALWCDAVSEYKDEFYELPACRMYPKPVQTPHPPLHFGGESDAALRRVADLGQGWYGFNRTPAEAREGIDRLERLLARRGRALSDVQVSISPYLKPLQDGDVAPLPRCRRRPADRARLRRRPRRPAAQPRSACPPDRRGGRARRAIPARTRSGLR